MSELSNKVVEFLRINGPSHPVQIGKVLGKDTMMTSAILSEVVKTGNVKMTQRKVGNSSLFFLPGQEEKVKEMLKKDLNFVENKLVERAKSKSFIPHSELTTQDKFILPELRDFLVPLKVKYGESEMVVWKHYTVSNETIMPSITEMMKKAPPKKIEAPKREIIRVPERKESIFGEKPPDKKTAPAVGFQAVVENWLSEKGIIVVKSDVKRKGKEIEYVIKMKEPVEQEFYVKCKDKKRVSESDITMTYTEAMQKKMPAMFITSGKVSKKLLKTIDKKFGGLVKVICI